MARKPILAANWKMHKTHADALQFAQKLHYTLERDDSDRADVVICGPFTSMRTLQTVIQSDRMPFALGAQNVYWEDKGAYTGEVSAPMLAALDVEYVIVGHSERRELFGEGDDWVRRKLDAVIAHGMTPILCVGETETEREAGEKDAKVSRQIAAGTAGLPAERVAGLVVAYEPIWAIGTGRTATPEDAQEMCGLIRGLLRESFGDAAEETRIQYGGSVKPGNTATLMAGPDVDGCLVGGASLDPEDFAAIVRNS